MTPSPDEAPQGLSAYRQARRYQWLILVANSIERARRLLVFLRCRKTRPILVAQGDSWFCYPTHRILDILQHLQGRHGYAVRTLAGASRTSQAMVTRRELRRLKQVVRCNRGGTVLLSAGGNDLIDILNARSLRAPGAGRVFQEAEVGREAVPTTYLSKDLGPVLAAVTGNILTLCDAALSAGAARVVLVGYDYLAALEKAGEVLLSLDRVSAPPSLHGAISRALIDELVKAQQAAVDARAELSYINLIGRTQPQADWYDEVHPNSEGFASAAAFVAGRLPSL